jgi:tRNA G18 (ribose-2'-O)-methylase SpoU
MASPGRYDFIVVLDHLKPAFKSLKIPQFGRVESLNVSIAASIVMYGYIRQNGGDF